MGFDEDLERKVNWLNLGEVSNRQYQEKKFIIKTFRKNSKKYLKKCLHYS